MNDYEPWEVPIDDKRINDLDEGEIDFSNPF